MFPKYDNDMVRRKLRRVSSEISWNAWNPVRSHEAIMLSHAKWLSRLSGCCFLHRKFISMISEIHQNVNIFCYISSQIQKEQLVWSCKLQCESHFLTKRFNSFSDLFYPQRRRHERKSTSESGYYYHDKTVEKVLHQTGKRALATRILEFGSSINAELEKAAFSRNKTGIKLGRKLPSYSDIGSCYNTS
jgi:hypothetical protein